MDNSQFHRCQIPSPSKFVKKMDTILTVHSFNICLGAYMLIFVICLLKSMCHVWASSAGTADSTWLEQGKGSSLG